MYWMVFLGSALVLLVGIIGIAYCGSAYRKYSKDYYKTTSEDFVQSLPKEGADKDAEEIISDALKIMKREGFAGFEIYKNYEEK